ncbi:MAG: hypothetical protein VX913_12935 [Planctomycetota bacterium]|nr:hypothetical protein [Planctomycetota bacterium]
MRTLALVALLGVAQWVLRPPTPSTAAQPVAERFSGAVHSAFLGGFRPMLVQYLWWDVEAAQTEGRHHDVIQNLALLQRVDPRNTKAILYMARFGAFTLSATETMPTRKLQRIIEAVDLLERSERRLPLEVTLPLLRAMILTAEWGSTDPRLYLAWSKRRGRTPYTEALRAMEAAAALAPNARVVRRLLAETMRYRATEMALADGDLERAHQLMARAVAIDASTPGAAATLGARLIVAWERILSGLALSDGAANARGLDQLRLTMANLDPPGADGDAREELLALAILRPCLDLGRSAVATGEPRDALSLILAVHKIQAAIEERVAARGGSGQRERILGDLKSLAANILERAPQLGDRIPSALR